MPRFDAAARRDGPLNGPRSLLGPALAVLVTVLVTVSAGCATLGNTEPTPMPPGVSGAASDQMVLRWRRTGGIAGRGHGGEMPDFSLYGDGRAIVPGDDPIEPREYRLTPPALRGLLDGARAAGLGRSRTAERDDVADAFTLEITFGRAVTRVEHPEDSPGDPAVRFWKRLAPAGWAAGDQAAPPQPYAFPRLAILSGETADEGGRSWPLVPLGAGTRLPGGLCSVVTGRDLPRAVALARTAAPETRWRSEGRTYSVRWRPMLPGETTCADLGRR
ncbi:hypothetical protein DPM19_20375 [Actinomadura craniellae]|uniref:Uncharacterized protein n=1 Tax=Actinomadura craniellae TaxID=2231787 RepID=A0A365H2U5_9ACTN|nr:hypothetical protein [Actinomadura craniellae]RAY13424.1 hypothetical protein DPM19_20375 [Actinomadura craniellae]